jgi:hypothetical protein
MRIHIMARMDKAKSPPELVVQIKDDGKGQEELIAPQQSRQRVG